MFIPKYKFLCDNGNKYLISVSEFIWPCTIYFQMCKNRDEHFYFNVVLGKRTEYTDFTGRIKLI